MSEKTNKHTVQLHISGMHCASCAANIERSLKKQRGVIEAQVNYANEQAMVVTQPKVSFTDLISVVKKAGYEARAESDLTESDIETERLRELDILKRKVVFSILLTAPLVLSMLPGIPEWFRNPWWLWVLASPIQFWIGWRFYQGAWAALKNRVATMDTLVVLGTTAAYGYSVVAILWRTALLELGIEPHVYFEASAAIITFVLLGKFLELKAKHQTTGAVRKLLDLQPATAHRWNDGRWEVVPVKSVMVGDRLLLKPGERVPVDGKVLHGETTVSEAMITGEAMPVAKTVGDRVIGATLNQSGSIEIEATKVGSETVLARIIQLVKQAQSSKPEVQQLADRIASIFVPVVIGLAVLTAAVWLVAGPKPALPFALVSMINVLIIACPCALGLATPAAVIVGVGRAAQAGILIKDAQALELAKNTRVVIFDKTGTLTEGKPTVQQFWFAGKQKIHKASLQIVYALESRSHHPLALALSQFASEHLTVAAKTPTVSHFKDVAGKGVQAKVGGKQVLAGNLSWLHQHSVSVPQQAMDLVVQWQTQGLSIVGLASDSKLLGLFGVGDTVRNTARQVIADLKQRGIHTALLSGDGEPVVKQLAESLGLDQWQGALLPQDKEQAIRSLRKKFGLVAMVGDGINDSPALAAADVSIALGTGTEIAMETAGITLLRPDLSLIPQALALSEATIRTIRQNLFWAFAYNVTLIPLAMGVLYPVTGWLLNPMLAGAAMAFSSVSVVVNALRLRSIPMTTIKE